MVKKVQIKRRRQSIGSDCRDCPWAEFGDTAPLARQHTRDTGHTTYFVIEETVVYQGEPDDRDSAL